MTASFPVLLDGYTDLPAGKIANIVTFLEIAAPLPSTSAPAPGLTTVRVATPGTGWYRALYTRIGQDWLWFSRAVMPDADLAAILANPNTEIVALEREGETIGLAELDFSAPGAAEIVTFGVVPEAAGTGAAQSLMASVLALAFRDGVKRVWLHTCTFDHPRALGFYRRQGFRAVKFAIEVSDDPRATGHLPRTAAPHIPLLD